MKYSRDRLTGLWILAVFIFLFIIYYHSRPFIFDWEAEPYADLFTISYWALVLWINIILDIILIYSITIGFYKRNNLARLYTIFYFCYSSFWNLYLLFIVRVWPYERYVWFVFYVIIIMYLLMSPVREYFGVKKLFI